MMEIDLSEGTSETPVDYPQGELPPNQTRRPLYSFVLLLAPAVILTFVTFSPGGTFENIDLIDVRMDKHVAASKFGRVCYRCSKPATKYVDYFVPRAPKNYPASTRLYFCADCDPPEEIRETIHTSAPGKKFNATVCKGLVLFALALQWLSLGLAWRPRTTVRTIVAVASCGLVASSGWWYHFARMAGRSE